jgi:hypothetical protein
VVGDEGDHGPLGTTAALERSKDPANLIVEQHHHPAEWPDHHSPPRGRPA